MVKISSQLKGVMDYKIFVVKYPWDLKWDKNPRTEKDNLITVSF